MTVAEAQKRFDEAVAEFTDAFMFCVALAGDPEMHARAIVDAFGPAHRALLEAGAELTAANGREADEGEEGRA